jgi:hypothetical protein
MKTLDIHELLLIAGGEPRGTTASGRQNDGSDIWFAGVDSVGNTYIAYEKDSVSIHPDGTKYRVDMPNNPPIHPPYNR